MEEVDEIVIHTLRQIGCDLDDEVANLKSFSTELLVEAASKCLTAINPALDIPWKLPPSMSARFRIGTSLASACAEMGYQGEIGYQTFLYSNEADVRKVFMFLIEKMPKESSPTSEETSTDFASVLKRQISAAVQEGVHAPWLPADFLKQQQQTCLLHDDGLPFRSVELLRPQAGLSDTTKSVGKARKDYYRKELSFVCEQPSDQTQLMPSLMSSNAMGVAEQQEWENEWNEQGLPSRLSTQEYRARKAGLLKKRMKEQLQQDLATCVEQAKLRREQEGRGQVHVQLLPSKAKSRDVMATTQLTSAKSDQMMAERAKTEEELEKEREEEREKMEEQLARIAAHLDHVHMEMKKLSGSKLQMSEQMSREQLSSKDKEDVYRVKKMTFDLLPDADNNLEKLQGVVDASAQRLLTLSKQWEKHRAPLVLHYRQLKLENSNRLSESQKKLEKIKELRKKMKDAADDVKSKEDLQKRLVAEYESMTKDVHRSVYTKRILEIVGNIKKQKADIDKVLIDTRALQKEINQQTGKLDRTFTVTDELIFKDAKKDESVRKAYKYLAALHENCNTLIETVEETGIIMREIRDLEDQIESEEKKKIEANLERLAGDYKQMKKENAHLLSKLTNSSK